VLKTFTLTKEQQQKLEHWINQRVNEKKPLQYILGKVPFCDLEILVEPPILIPRPETEEIVCWLIEQIKQQGHKNLSILDVCCGSGCIGLALARAFPEATVVGLDINEQAIDLSEKNKKHNNISNISFVQSDLYQALSKEQVFDIIISNPPYLSEESYENVSDEIRIWEDKQALVAQHDGMALYEKIIAQSHNFLKQTNKGPHLVLEIGIDQNTIKELFIQAGFTNIEIHNDMSGKKRWITGSIAG